MWAFARPPLCPLPPPLQTARLRPLAPPGRLPVCCYPLPVMTMTNHDLHCANCGRLSAPRRAVTAPAAERLCPKHPRPFPAPRPRQRRSVDGCARRRWPLPVPVPADCRRLRFPGNRVSVSGPGAGIADLGGSSPARLKRGSRSLVSRCAARLLLPGPWDSQRPAPRRGCRRPWPWPLLLPAYWRPSLMAWSWTAWGWTRCARRK